MQLTDSEIKVLETKYEDGINKVKKTFVTSLIFSFVLIVLPVDLWNIIIIPRKRALNLPDVTEPMYQNITMIVILCFVIILATVLSYIAFVYFIKKDLKFKEKIGGTFKVVRIENISKMVAEKLDGQDTILHFEKNSAKIDKHLFKKAEKPELLNAHSIFIECSKYSRTLFKEEIVYDNTDSNNKVEIVRTVTFNDFGGVTPELVIEKSGNARLLVELPPFYDGEGHEINGDDDFPEVFDFEVLLSEYVDVPIEREDREVFVIHNMNEQTESKLKDFFENYWKRREERYKKEK